MSSGDVPLFCMLLFAIVVLLSPTQFSCYSHHNLCLVKFTLALFVCAVIMMAYFKLYTTDAIALLRSRVELPHRSEERLWAGLVIGRGRGLFKRRKNAHQLNLAPKMLLPAIKSGKRNIKTGQFHAGMRHYDISCQ